MVHSVLKILWIALVAAVFAQEIQEESEGQTGDGTLPLDPELPYYDMYTIEQIMKDPFNKIVIFCSSAEGIDDCDKLKKPLELHSDMLRRALGVATFYVDITKNPPETLASLGITGIPTPILFCLNEEDGRAYPYRKDLNDPDNIGDALEFIEFRFTRRGENLLLQFTGLEDLMDEITNNKPGPILLLLTSGTDTGPNEDALMTLEKLATRMKSVLRPMKVICPRKANKGPYHEFCEMMEFDAKKGPMFVAIIDDIATKMVFDSNTSDWELFEWFEGETLEEEGKRQGTAIFDDWQKKHQAEMPLNELFQEFAETAAKLARSVEELESKLV